MTFRPSPESDETAGPAAPLPELPDSARLWVYGADRELSADETDRLERDVRGFVDGWAAHGAALKAGLELAEARFLIIAADESSVRASGCSIDGLVRCLAEAETRLDCSLLDGQILFFRGASGEIRSCDRDGFRALAADGSVTRDTPVFDLTVATLGDLRAGRFELPLAKSWHRRLVTEVLETA